MTLFAAFLGEGAGSDELEEADDDEDDAELEELAAELPVEDGDVLVEERLQKALAGGHTDDDRTGRKNCQGTDVPHPSLPCVLDSRATSRTCILGSRRADKAISVQTSKFSKKFSPNDLNDWAGPHSPSAARPSRHCERRIVASDCQH